MQGNTSCVRGRPSGCRPSVLGSAIALGLTFVATDGVAAPRLLVSHYAPTVEGPVTVLADDRVLGLELAYGETDERYRYVDPGPVKLVAVDADGRLLARAGLAAPDGDHSVVLYTDADGAPALAVLPDHVSAIPGTRANTLVRVLNFAHFDTVDPPRVTTQVRTLVEDLADGTVSVYPGWSKGGDLLLAKQAGLELLETSSAQHVELILRVGSAGERGVELGEPLLEGVFPLASGSADLVLVGGAEEQPVDVLIRPRPENRNRADTGLYGDHGINGSGIDLVEDPAASRAYGLLFTYEPETGAPRWLYFDSTCERMPPDSAYRALACTEPASGAGAEGVYRVTYYEVIGGSFGPGKPADAEIVGFGELRLARNGLEPDQRRTARLQVVLDDLERLLADEVPRLPEGVRFEFERIDR